MRGRPLPRTSLPVLTPRAATRWTLVQRAAVVVLVSLPVAFLAAPEVVLSRFWSGVVPLLPVLFLINPALWRNVCPLATAGTGPDRPGRAAGPAPFGESRATELGLVILLLLIPLRPVGLEESALASSGLVLLLAGGALVGRRSPRKGGFCNGWCPVLAVERLYGQVHLLPVANARCPECTTCTPDGCIDLSVRAAQAQLLGPGRSSREWLLSPWGMFMAAFPGVIVTFFLMDALPAAGGSNPSPLVQAYGWTIWGGASSWVAAWLILRATRVPWRVATLLLGGLSAALFLWFALPGVAAAWGATHLVGQVLRGCGLLLVLLWLGTGLRTATGVKTS